MDRDRRTTQPESMGDASGDVVLLVAHHDGEFTQPAGDVRSRREVTLEIGGVVHATEDSDRARRPFRNVAGVLEGMPRHFEEVPMLRIHELRFERRDAKERGIEEFDVIEYAAGSDIRRIATQLRRNRVIDFLGREPADRLNAVAQVGPEGFDVASAGEAAGHSDDRNRLAHIAAEAAGRAGCGHTACAVNGQSQRGRCWSGEERGRRNVGQAGFPQPDEQTHRRKRITTQLEEAVVYADFVQHEFIGEHAADQRFPLASGGAHWLTQLGSPASGSRQRGAIELAVRGQRKREQRDEDRRHHEIGQ